MAKIVLDLHDIYNKGITIDTELNRVIVEAIEKKIALVEIIPGKGSGQLKKRILRFLLKPEVKKTVSSAGEGRQEFWQGFRTFQTLGYKHFTGG